MKQIQSSKGKSRGLLVFFLVLGLSLPGQIYAQAERSFIQSETPYLVAGSQTGYFIPDQILVKFTKNLSNIKRIQYIQTADVSLINELPQLGVSVLRVPGGKVAETVARFLSNSDVLYAEPNFVAHMTDTIPSDPGWGNQYGLLAIHAPQGWDFTTGSTTEIIAIVDTGVDLGHVDLATKIIPGYDFVNNDSLPQDDNGHGTHVAGIAGALSNNGIGIAGVSWGALIMPVKVLDASGSGSYANVAAGIIWAADNGAKVINLSLGGADPSTVLEEAVNYAYGKGVTVVASAGNSGSNSILYPARYPHVIAVGATDSSNNRASFSNTGSELDVVAPGVGIYSTLMGNNYGTLSGTSMAAPFVSGLAAILMGFPANNSPDVILSEIETTALDLGLPGRDDLYGYGLIQMDAAIQSIWSTPTPTLTETLTTTDFPLPPLPPTATYTDTLQPTSTFKPTATFTNTLKPRPTFTPTSTFTSSPTPTPTYIPTDTYTIPPQPTATFTPSITSTSTPQPTATFTPTDTSTNTPLPTASFTPTDTSTSIPQPTATFTATTTLTKTHRTRPTFTPTPTMKWGGPGWCRWLPWFCHR